MNLINDTREQLRKKAEALNAAMPVPDYAPDLVYGKKEFTRMPKSGVSAKPNHLGRGLASDFSVGNPGR